MTRRLQQAALAAGVALLLAACGGGDDASEGPTRDPSGNQVPASATSSATAWAAYAASLVANETGAPVDVNNATPPTTEVGAPNAL